LTTGFVFHRDLWPRLFSSGPPPVSIELADEARQNVPARWTIKRNGTPVGKLTTQMKYLDAEDAFQFSYRYTDLKLEQGSVTLVFSEVVSDVRMTRAGDLKSQAVTGNATIQLQGVELARSTIDVRGVVINGKLEGRAELKNNAVALLNLEGDLEPVPVPAGLPLNPLQPVNRLAYVQGGKQWVVHEANPLQDAMNHLLRKKGAELGVRLPEEKPKESLVAKVSNEPQPLNWKGEEVSCWVIEYRRTEIVARTWVSVKDGKVLLQEAFEKGESLTFERED
jgi:hypothetical protein